MAAAVCGLLALLLGLPFAGGTAPGAVDAQAAAAVARLGPAAARILVLPTEPYVVVVLAALAVFLCLRAGRRLEAVLALAGPLLAILLNTWLLKPVYDRWKNDTLVYPSGHTVGLVSVLTVLVLVTRRTYVVVLSALALLAAAAGLVGMGYHYLTDVVGGTLFAVAVVLVTWSVPRRVPAPSTG
ncbi:phosphatase PAP2 family protein [Amycolatopsis sp., V23-08]|uniref:Phosphatase PAP2 family protein n=1 Tax=Amycolatopsis heterodermiae TaxID=3110235 RepID=A0ABU5RLY6_9PSEU|nr:phosphatase PAP2 family protein [Amycolatopsis sp., V23-08]MEA5366141.1 phosphatase PAP2 family protein [Amycolatopsis sp., V23-08]